MEEWALWSRLISYKKKIFVVCCLHIWPDCSLSRISFHVKRETTSIILDLCRYMCVHVLELLNLQSLSQESKVCTNIADTGSAATGTLQCMQFFAFLFIFPPVISRPSFTSWTPNEYQRREQLFYYLVIQVLYPGDIHVFHSEWVCACYLQVLEKMPRTSSGMLWFAW